MYRISIPLTCDFLLMAGGADGFTCLHYCIDMRATQALRYLEALPDIDMVATDNMGRTYKDLAAELGHSSMIHEQEKSI